METLRSGEENAVSACPRLKQFNDDKLGLFVHWGPYSQLAGCWKDRSSVDWAEWIQLHARIPKDEYAAAAKRFLPRAFDADRWVSLAKSAGFRYIVYGSKHHDGFCMFQTGQTSYNIVDHGGYGRDPLSELATACRQHNMRLGIYYSIADWHHPHFPAEYSNLGSNFHGDPNPNAEMARYADYQIEQVRELLTNYGPISTMWFDGGGSYQKVDRFRLMKGEKLVETIRELQPNCLINDRIGGCADYGTPEQQIPGSIQRNAFEVCMTISEQWGYNQYDRNYKTAKELIKRLIDTVHRGGNLLLNVGPDGNGVIPEACETPLRKLGDWLSRNGEAVYGTRNSLAESPAWEGGMTTRFADDQHLIQYCICTRWPDNGTLRVPTHGLDVGRVTVLGDHRTLETSHGDEALIITMPPDVIDPIAWVVRVDLHGPHGIDSELKHPTTKRSIHTVG